ncbi:acetylglutamate kinase [Eubacterium pyruvativorans]|uniref:acetylglutamate kinase n=1 Tax=Eubacterium pyruvativorans TaxID=155865 RepID=UPI00087F89A5|nr:acetylglutamate kinase [Eubacterium pyruvativorans]MDO5568339.1 acetylglutamate kinase [Eubacteriales bacterium]MCI5747714.1 acetylglutamate kinase [Eubacterium pyruvativorans]MDD7684426.1 acetylglutamate kinase [Eubacterium pyruvativorans]MDY4048741.1 acetylglutamate kinase [Eubacterium pyruvativorans]SDE85976.1 N-acetylglutamate kinase [Eubacterium pyruvativorans]
MTDREKDQEKAQILIEALPYIQRFNGNTVVVKYGGSAMKDEDLKMHVIEDVALLKLVGMRPIIVHGGGKEISRWVKKSGIVPEFYNGLRITDRETLEVAEMVLGKVNTDLVSLVQQLGVNAMGISGMDGDLLKVRKVMPDGQDIGFVGEVTRVNPDILWKLLDDDFVPVIFPIGSDKEGNAYNINGDHAAAAIAQAIHADKLIYLTDTRGVYRDPSDPDTLISELDEDEALRLIDEGVVQGGMIPKIRNCIDSIRNGVRRVHILDGSAEHSILLEIFTDRGVGTAIMEREQQRYYRGA